MPETPLSAESLEPHPGTASHPSPADGAELSEGAARAVLGVAAVIRLEPTLKNSLHRLQAAANRWRPDASVTAAGDGISLRRRGTVVDVHADIAVSPSRPAHLTAADVQDVVRRFLTA